MTNHHGVIDFPGPPSRDAGGKKTITRKGAGRKVVSEMKDWGTPAKYVAAVTAALGGTIELDPCSNSHSLVKATVVYRPPTSDGLHESWRYGTIFVNPPYGNDKEKGTTIRHWLEKCAHAHEAYNSEVIALVPVAVNTMHWKKYVFTKARAVCFLYDTRLRFLENGMDCGKGAPMACAVVYWGHEPGRFYDVFIHHGAVVDISNLLDKQIGPESRFPKLALSKA